jgi:hypothetical protein
MNRRNDNGNSALGNRSENDQHNADIEAQQEQEQGDAESPDLEQGLARDEPEPPNDEGDIHVIGAVNIVPIDEDNTDDIPIDVDTDEIVAIHLDANECIAVHNIDSESDLNDNAPYAAAELVDSIKPAFISAHIYKRYTGEKLGIRLHRHEIDRECGKTIISSVLPDGIFFSTPLQIGHELISIDNKPCGNWGKNDIEQYLRNKKGLINIVAQDPFGDPNYVVAMIQKEHRSDLIGVGLVIKRHRLRVSSITPCGLAARTVLNIGDYVQTINNVSCLHVPSETATSWIRTARTVTILTKTERSTGVVVCEGREWRFIAPRPRCSSDSDATNSTAPGSHNEATAPNQSELGGNVTTTLSEDLRNILLALVGLFTFLMLVILVATEV